MQHLEPEQWGFSRAAEVVNEQKLNCLFMDAVNYHF